MKCITIIIPIYNVENYLTDCLDSILNQSYNNLEVILVDDKSKDNSLAIARSYADKYSFLLIEKSENEGLSEARNSALKIMKGDFVMFLDSDDILHPETCKTLLEIGKENNSDIVSFRNFRFLNDFTFEPIENIKCKNITPLEELSNGVMACARLYKVDLFEGVTFPSGILSEDTATVPILLCKAKVLTTVNINLYGYRLPGPNSLTSNGLRLMEDSPQAIRLLLTKESIVNSEIIEYLTIKTFITLIRRFIITKPMWKNDLDCFIEKNSDLASILKNNKSTYPLTKKDKKYANSLIRYISSGSFFTLYPFVISRMGKIIKRQCHFLTKWKNALY